MKHKTTKPRCKRRNQHNVLTLKHERLEYRKCARACGMTLQNWTRMCLNAAADIFHRDF